MTSRSDTSAAAIARSPDRHNPLAVGRGQLTGWLWAHPHAAGGQKG
jgi:hypothetical protein